MTAFRLLLRRTLRRMTCDHRHEIDTSVRGTKARVQWCPVCLRTKWVD